MKIELEIDDEVARSLASIGIKTPAEVLMFARVLLCTAHAGILRPGSWEDEWLRQVTEVPR